ncbi:ATP-dependent DNA helicase [Lachnospiraceae bacterium 62-35]
MKEEIRKIKISVRNLVEFVLRSGDLDNRRTAGAQKEAMQEGSRLHKKIQKRMGSTYQAEVSLKHIVEEEEFQIEIEGRADGIITEASGITIDEIKCIYQDLSRKEEADQVHLAQARCYGYFYSFQKEIATIGIQITYCNIETEEIRRFQEEKSYEELEEWFMGLVHEYVKWARYQYHHEVRRDESIKALEFPYPYREGQKDLAVAVYRTLSRGKRLFIQAPTGIGKTLSAIYPSLKAVGEGYGNKLFYLTAKTITGTVAENTFAILRDKGLYFSTVTITAKEKLCFMERTDCNPESCPYAKGHFNRVNDAVYEIIHKESGIDRELILSYAESFRICPFEFCLDITDWTDGIICDYNYVFDPNVRLKRYFADNTSGEYLFLIDEAHNLVSRAREMYSEILIKEEILLVKRILKGQSLKLERLLDRCNRILLEMKRECEEVTLFSELNHLILPLASMFGELETYMEEHLEFEDRDLVLEFYFRIRNFLSIYELVDENYQIYGEIDRKGQFVLRLFCVNPSRNLIGCLNQGQGAVFFSATLLPVNYYKELLSGDREDYAIYAKSPFKQENRLLLIARDVSSRYRRRNQREYRKIADYIEGIAGTRKGNYIAFFPSYRYMEEIDAILREMGPDFQWVVQKNGMKEEEREEFLAMFEKEYPGSFVALCVMGGLFSEGIDLREERLIGAILVGTGLPMVCTEQEILKHYFEERDKDGFQFAYQYPGMNKVMQAAGRVIRTPEDKGVIALLDDRFLEPDYQALFPLEWSDCEIVNQRSVRDRVRRFWEEEAAE